MFPTTNVLFRVFNIRAPNGKGGTAFALDIEGREYLVTARHVATELTGGSVGVFRSGQWVDYALSMVGHGPSNVDVSVLALPVCLIPKENRFPLPATMAGITYGQETMFLGFPIGYDPVSAFQLHNGYPIPLVKYAKLSSLPPKGYPMSLDGDVNSGFSGSPLCFARDHNKPGELTVAGVVVAAQNIKKPVYSATGTETGQYVYESMGLGRGWDIQHALDLVNANPIGPVIQ